MAYTALATACLGTLFSDRACRASLAAATTTTPSEDSAPPAAAASTAAAQPSSTAGRPPKKRARGSSSSLSVSAAVRASEGGAVGGSNDLAGADRCGDGDEMDVEGAAAGPAKQRGEAGDGGGVGDEAPWAAVVVTYSARLVAAEALAELVRVAEAANVTAAAAAAVAAGTQQVGGARRRRDVGVGVGGGGDIACPLSGSGGSRGGSGRRSRVGMTPRELVLSEASRRAGSEWAWEKELAFLLIETCAGKRREESMAVESGSSAAADAR